MDMKMYGGKRSMKRSRKCGGSKKCKMGGKKSNGHKSTCSCPICKNMKKSGGTRRRRR